MNILSSSREEKSLILREIIGKLNIEETEKDLYIFSMDILENSDFEKFFEKIVGEFEKNTLHII